MPLMMRSWKVKTNTPTHMKATPWSWRRRASVSSRIQECPKMKTAPSRRWSGPRLPLQITDRLFRRQHHDDLAALETRLGFNLGDLDRVAFHPVEQLPA